MPTSTNSDEAIAPSESEKSEPTAFTSPVTRVTSSPVARRSWKASERRWRCAYAAMRRSWTIRSPARFSQNAE
jgi:hypothetical protein